MVSLSSALRAPVACLLPDPARLEDCLSVEQALGREVPEPAPPVVAVGRVASRRLEHLSLPALPVRPRLWLFPPCGSPRSLLPDRFTRHHQSELLRERVTGRSNLRRLTTATPRSLPAAMVRYGARPVQLALQGHSAIVNAAGDIAPQHVVGFVLNPNNHFRPVMLVFDREAKVAAVAKCSLRGHSGGIHREWAMLKSVSRMPGLAASAPTPLKLVSGHLVDAMFISAAQGRPAPPRLIAPIDRWLGRCLLGGGRPVGSSSLVDRLLRELDSAEPDARLRAAAEAATRRLAGVDVPVTLVHGDFAPWNVRIDHGSVRVFDWEYGSLDGIPSWDRIHFKLQTGLLLERWTARELVEQVHAQASTHEGSADGVYTAREHVAVAALVLVQLALRTSRGGMERVRERITEALGELELS